MDSENQESVWVSGGYSMVSVQFFIIWKKILYLQNIYIVLAHHRHQG